MSRNVRHVAMRRYTAFSGILILLLLGYTWKLARNSVVPVKRDLSVVFVGFTNNPQHTMQPVRVEVVQGATGRCALFRVTSVSTNNYIRFNTSSVESNDGRGWAQFAPVSSWAGVEGSVWSPGYSCLYAVAWPPGLPTNMAWRLQLSVAREPSGLREYVNRKLGREVFGPYRRQAMVSSEVSQ